MAIGLQRKIYKKLAWLNELPPDEAEYVFREASGSEAWARAMSAARPFPMLEQLFGEAERLWPHGNFEAVEERLKSLLER